jgi:hypothetical protein
MIIEIMPALPNVIQNPSSQHLVGHNIRTSESPRPKARPEYQRLSWDALRKSITGLVNRVNIANIKQIVPELFSENLI